jgi:hypothetical protein
MFLTLKWLNRLLFVVNVQQVATNLYLTTGMPHTHLISLSEL